MNSDTFSEAADKMVADAFALEYDLCVLVEDIYDISFWRYIIEFVLPNLKDKIDFPVPSPKGTRGKDEIALGGDVGGASRRVWRSTGLGDWRHWVMMAVPIG